MKIAWVVVADGLGRDEQYMVAVIQGYMMSAEEPGA
jgi:cyanate lyase